MRWILLLIPSVACAANCVHPDNRADSAICATPELKAKDQEIESLTPALKSKLSAENAAVLTDTELPFVRLRNNCANESDVPTCLRTVLSERLDLLTRAQSDPAAIRQAVAQARFIDIGFLWKYWPQLVGRKVSVFGCFSPADTGPKTRAELETENQPAVPMLFKSMPEDIADFLDDQKPCAHWLVTVRKEGDKFILYADEVLGRPLP